MQKRKEIGDDTKKVLKQKERYETCLVKIPVGER